MSDMMMSHHEEGGQYAHRSRLEDTHREGPTTAELYNNLSCAPCRRKPVCGGTYDCLTDLYPDSVLESLAGLLRDKPASGPVVAS